MEGFDGVAVMVAVDRVPPVAVLGDGGMQIVGRRQGGVRHAVGEGDGGCH